MSIGIAEMNAGRRIEGEARLRRAHAMWPDSPRPLQLLAFYYRLDGLCAPALPLLAQALRQRPQDGYTRVPYVACLLDQGYYPAAARIARAGSQADPHSEILALAAAVADSAHRHGIPPQSVRLPPVAGGLTLIGAPRAIRGGQ